MAGKPFNPFEDDDNMEFVPGGEGEENPLASQPTRIKQVPVERPQRQSNLKLDFKELEELGTDTRGAVQIGAEKLGADEFLKGIKRKDYTDALDRAKASQNAPAHVPVQESRIARQVRTPLYLFLALVVAVVAGLGWWGTQYVKDLKVKEAERQRALERLEQNGKH